MRKSSAGFTLNHLGRRSTTKKLKTLAASDTTSKGTVKGNGLKRMKVFGVKASIG